MNQEPGKIITPEELKSYLLKEELKRRMKQVHLDGRPKLTVPPIRVRIPTDTTNEVGEAVSPAEYRRRTKKLRKARRAGNGGGNKG